MQPPFTVTRFTSYQKSCSLLFATSTDFPLQSSFHSSISHKSYQPFHFLSLHNTRPLHLFYISLYHFLPPLPFSYRPHFYLSPPLTLFYGYDSAKLQYLAGFIRFVCFEKIKKLLFFVAWSYNLWLVFMFLQGVLGIECLTIQATHINTERGEIEDMFNDPKHPAKCLIASIRTSGTALKPSGVLLGRGSSRPSCQ